MSEKLVPQVCLACWLALQVAAFPSLYNSLHDGCSIPAMGFAGHGAPDKDPDVRPCCPPNDCCLGPACIQRPGRQPPVVVLSSLKYQQGRVFMTSAVIVNTAHGGCSTYLHTCPEHVHRLVCSCLVSIEAAGDTVKSHQNEPYEGIPSEGQVQMTVRNKTPTDCCLPRVIANLHQ